MFEGAFALYYREMRIWSRTWYMIVTFIATPIFLIALFGLAMSGLVPEMEYQGENINYLLFLIPGVIAMGIHGNASSVLWNIFSERRWGGLEQILSAPVSRSAYGLSKILLVVTQSLIQLPLILLIGYALVEKQILIPNNLLLLLVATFLGSICFCSFYMILGSTIGTQDLLITVINLIMMPMIFCSSMFYPLEMMPYWLGTIAKLNPMTYIADGLRAGLIGSINPEILLGILVLFIFSLVLFTASVISMRKVRI
jgi:ABC-2 type transport system permease protein